MERQKPEDYSRAEIDEIFRLALKQQVADDQRASRQELLDVARTMGIDPALLDGAIAQYEQDGRKVRAREIWLKRKRDSFRESVRDFALLMPFLFAINLIAGSGWWVQWVFLLFGAILLFEAGQTYWPSEKHVDKGAEKLLKKAMYSGKSIEEM